LTLYYVQNDEVRWTAASSWSKTVRYRSLVPNNHQ